MNPNSTRSAVPASIGGEPVLAGKPAPTSPPAPPRAAGPIWISLPILSTFEIDELILALNHRRSMLIGRRRSVHSAETRAALSQRLVQLDGIRHRLAELDRKVNS